MELPPKFCSSDHSNIFLLLFDVFGFTQTIFQASTRHSQGPCVFFGECTTPWQGGKPHEIRPVFSVRLLPPTIDDRVLRCERSRGTCGDQVVGLQRSGTARRTRAVRNRVLVKKSQTTFVGPGWGRTEEGPSVKSTFWCEGWEDQVLVSGKEGGGHRFFWDGFFSQSH